MFVKITQLETKTGWPGPSFAIKVSKSCGGEERPSHLLNLDVNSENKKMKWLKLEIRVIIIKIILFSGELFSVSYHQKKVLWIERSWWQGSPSQSREWVWVMALERCSTTTRVRNNNCKNTPDPIQRKQGRERKREFYIQLNASILDYFWKMSRNGNVNAVTKCIQF